MLVVVVVVVVEVVVGRSSNSSIDEGDSNLSTKGTGNVRWSHGLYHFS